MRWINKKRFGPTASLLQSSWLSFPRAGGTACLKGQVLIYIYFQLYYSLKHFSNNLSSSTANRSIFCPINAVWFQMLEYKITAKIRDLGCKAEQVRVEQPPTEPDTSGAFLGSGAAAARREAWGALEPSDGQSENRLQLTASSSKPPLAQLCFSPGPVTWWFSEWLFFMSQNWSRCLTEAGPGGGTVIFQLSSTAKTPITEMEIQ